MHGIERDEVVDRVAEVLRPDERIAGLVLIGSGAVGYIDEWSDVDLVAVVAHGHDEGTVSDDLITAIRDALPVVWQLESSTIPTLRSLLLRRDEPLKSTAQLADLRDALAHLYALSAGRPATVARNAADTLPDDQRTRLVELTVAPEPDALDDAFAHAAEALHDLETDRTANLIDARHLGLSKWIAAKYGIDRHDRRKS